MSCRDSLDEVQMEMALAKAEEVIKESPQCDALVKSLHDRFVYYESEFQDAFGLELSEYWRNDYVGFDLFKFLDWLEDKFDDIIEEQSGYCPSTLTLEQFGESAEKMVEILITEPAL
jgi:hypothetical protein